MCKFCSWHLWRCLLLSSQGSLSKGLICTMEALDLERNLAIGCCFTSSGVNRNSYSLFSTLFCGVLAKQEQEPGRPLWRVVLLTAVSEAFTPEANDFHIVTSFSQALCFCYLKATLVLFRTVIFPYHCNSYFILKVHSCELANMPFDLKSKLVELLINWLSYKQILESSIFVSYIILLEDACLLDMEQNRWCSRMTVWTTNGMIDAY